MADTADAGIRLSMIIPCYRVEKYLARCLDSVLAQTLEGIELVCINDGSDDNCLKILKEYRDRFPERFIIIDKENEGVWKARRDGIAAANGEYIGFIDPDDHIRNDFARKLYQAATEDDADVACCGFDRIEDETGRAYSTEMTGFKYSSFDIRRNPGLLLEVNAAIWNKIYRADVLKSMQDMQETPRAMDDLIFANLIYLNVHRITFVRESLVYYTVRSDSIVSSIRQEYVPGIYRAMTELRRIYETDAPEMLAYLDSAAFLHLGIALMHRLSSDPGTDLTEAIAHNTAHLDREHPLWRKSPYIKLSYVLSHRGANLKLYIVRRLYSLHLFRLFLIIYGRMIRHLGIDIKW